MRQKIHKIGLLFLLIGFIIMQKSYAKYALQDNLKIPIFLDKTLPIIHITSGGQTQSFEKTQPDILKKTEAMTITTTDNIAIKDNQYCYHPDNPNFDGAERHKFENILEITEEGYYEIVTTDTSGNSTKIVILLQKSPPKVWVEYFKKGENSAGLKLHNTRKIAGIRRYFTTENGNEIPEEEVIEENQEESQNNEENVDDNNITSETIEEIKVVQEAEKITVEENTERVKEPIVQTQPIVESENIENVVVQQVENPIMPMAISDMYVGNEFEFRQALEMRASVIHIRQSINFATSVTIDYPVKITNASNENALRYWNAGSFFIVQKGGFLNVDGVVIDTNSCGRNDIIAINIQPGGYVEFNNNSIVDGGIMNIGILIHGEGSLVLWSCEIVRCAYGINLQSNGNLYFVPQEGRSSNFYWNTTAIFIDNFYGRCYFNQDINIHDNTEFGIMIANSSGEIYISSGTYYENKYGVHTRNITGGNVIISGGSFFANAWALWVGGNLNLTGGSIYNNYYGVLIDATYSGSFQMTGGNILSNIAYGIYHTKFNDGGCTITGGNIQGEIYLEKENNYVNTNSSYPTFTVTPSSYYFKRKLVKTTNYNTANLQISNVSLTAKDNWYQYVDNEYIVLWSGGNVVARYKDYNGNIIKQEIINGAIGTNYFIVPPTISGYDLIKIPSNSHGIYTQNDIFVDFQYDLVNVAKVTFEDLLSGVVSAKYWYNEEEENFSGEGIDFINGNIFEKYGYYKVKVINAAGLEKEIMFLLNKDSFIRENS